MSRFAATLRALDARLDLPQPARGRLLLEVAADLEDLFLAHRERGLAEADAHREALADCDLSDEAVAALVRVHCGPVRRALDRLSADALRVWERVLLGLAVLAVVQTGGWLSRGDRVFRDAGPFAWAVLLTAAVAVAMALALAYRLYAKQDHRPHQLRGRLDLLLGLAVLMAFLGFGGTWVEVWRLAAEGRAQGGETTALMLRWALRATALLQVSLGLALISALSWFGLAGTVGRIERCEAELLLGER